MRTRRRARQTVMMAVVVAVAERAGKERALEQSVGEGRGVRVAVAARARTVGRRARV